MEEIDLALDALSTVDVDLEAATEIKALLTEDETHSRCKDILTQSIFMYGLQARPAGGGEKQDPPPGKKRKTSKSTNAAAPEETTSAALETIFSLEDLNKLAFSAFIDYVTQGFTVFTFAPKTNDPRSPITPCIVPLRNIRIRKHILKTHRVWTTIKPLDDLTLMPDKLHRPKQDLFYYEWFNHEPDPETGAIRSMLAPFVHLHRSHILKRKCHDIAVMQASHPPVMIQQAPEKETFTNVLQTTQIGQSPLGILADEHSKQQKLVHYKEVQETKIQNFNNTPPDSFINSAVPITANSTQRFYPSPVDNIHPVPAGYVMASSAAPAVPQSDYLEFEHTKDLKICSAWRIPPSIANLDRAKSSSKHDSIGDNDMEMFSKTNQFFAKQIMDFVHYVRAVYTDTPVENLTVKFELPLLPLVSTRSLYELYGQNIIHFDSLRNRLIQINGLSEDDMATGENEITRPPPGGNENMTSAIMRNKERALAADAKEREEKALLFRFQRSAEAQEGQNDVETAKVESEIKDKELEMKQLDLKAKEQDIKLKKQDIALQKVKNKAPVKPAASSR